MHILKSIVFVLLTSASASACLAAGPPTRAQWEQCVGKAEASVNQMEVGVLGVEAKIKSMCGDPPVPATAASAGAQPYDLVRSPPWRPKFVAILKGKYNGFVERLAVGSPSTRDGDLITGSGLMPHRGGTDEAAFAIDTRTGQVFAAMLEDGKKLSSFGVAQGQQVPVFIADWMKEHKP
ncbi:MAG: hypothetical protein KJ901_20465 [Gammaproteobacteria bacterium]|nr:hypothetical protein [Gammaproteobacteria bacterium]MBU1441274.1 hypothetical protein [Gammaproteobacteria bacterium]